VGPDASGEHDQLILSLARELLVNAAKHAEANQVTVAVAHTGSELVLEVGDDGRGIDLSRLASAPTDGHIGLASCAQRVEALGGDFTVLRGEPTGTRVLATIPLVGARAQG